MSTQLIYLILVLAALVLFAVYIAVAIKLFGVPESLSNTYYLYESKKKGLGWIFTIFMWLEALLLIAPWVVLSDSFGPWESYLTFLAAFTCFGIAFVGTAPKFKEDGEAKVHVISAIVCSVSAMLWDFIPCWKIMYVPVIGALVPIVAATLTKTWDKSKIFWLEMCAFVSSFATILTEQIIQICQSTL